MLYHIQCRKRGNNGRFYTFHLEILQQFYQVCSLTAHFIINHFVLLSFVCMALSFQGMDCIFFINSCQQIFIESMLYPGFGDSARQRSKKNDQPIFIFFRNLKSGYRAFQVLGIYPADLLTKVRQDVLQGYSLQHCFYGIKEAAGVGVGASKCPHNTLSAFLNQGPHPNSRKQ